MNSIITGGYSSIEQAAGKLSNKKDTSQASGSSGISFQDILKQKKNIAEVILAKHRAGSTGTVELLWLGNYTKFVNIDKYREQ